eukprot:6040519-Prymnesium_polylepis.2
MLECLEQSRARESDSSGAATSPGAHDELRSSTCRRTLERHHQVLQEYSSWRRRMATEYTEYSGAVVPSVAVSSTRLLETSTLS